MRDRFYLTTTLLSLYILLNVIRHAKCCSKVRSSFGGDVKLPDQRKVMWPPIGDYSLL